MGRICDQESRIHQGLPVQVRERYLGGRCDIKQACYVGLEEAETGIEEQGCGVVEARESGKVD